MSASPLAAALGNARRELELAWAREEELAGYAIDPVAYCRQRLRFEPWSKQREILESVRDNTRTAVRSCHGAGKTAIAARCALWFLEAFPQSRVITTAPTWPQVKDLLWREIHVGYQDAGMVQGSLHDARLELAPDWFAVGLSTDQPERFQGHHAEHLLLIVDEASGVNEGIYEAAEGFLTSPGARLLLIGNPTKNEGTFYRAFHSERALWSLVAISAFDTPAFTGEQVSSQTLAHLVSREWVEEHRPLWCVQDRDSESGWSDNSPIWQVRVLGQFSTVVDDTIIPLGEVEAAQKRDCGRATPVILACDVARFGSDETVLALREGKRVRIVKVLREKDTMQVVGEIIDQVRQASLSKLDHPQVVVDDAGLGGGVTDRLRELQRERVLHSAVRIWPFNAAERAREEDGYPNRRSELWFEFAERLPELDLDPDDQLAGDLVAPRYALDSRGRRVLEPKEKTKQRIGRSPDRADAVLMCFAADRNRAEQKLTLDDDEWAMPSSGLRPGMAL